jgi:hypothetical protein
LAIEWQELCMAATHCSCCQQQEEQPGLSLLLLLLLVLVRTSEHAEEACAQTIKPRHLQSEGRK